MVEMNDKLVSVIVPVFNADKYIENVIKDILIQTYDKLELILINDGSTDGSKLIMQEYAQQDGRVRIIDKKNAGQSSARNIGLNAAKGQYIRFIDADDRIPYNSIELLVKAIEKNKDIDLVIGNYITVPEKKLVMGDTIKSGRVNPNEFQKIFIENVRTFYMGVPWNKLYRKEIIDKYNIRFAEDVIWCEDFLFNINYYEKCKFFYFLYTKEGIYNYCLRESSITHTLKKQNNDVIYDKVNELCYKKAKEYCDQYGNGEIFDIEWNGSEIYAKLSDITKNELKRSVAIIYREFEEIIMQPSTYAYIDMKAKRNGAYMWNIMNYMIKNKQNLMLFCLFLIKGYFVNNMNGITKIMREKFKKFIPVNW